MSAIMASACCWLPLVLLAAGVSGARIAAALEAYRPVLMVVTADVWLRTGDIATIDADK